MSVPYLIELMGLIGNITGTMLSFIWPALFHLRIKAQFSSDQRDRRFDYFIIATGICVMSVGIYYSSIELANAIQYGQR
ncbi:unnamed protein product [Anisakis simplex]|uniref:Vesicular GABA transporter (inferred by orthology to a C. elegans protein) n=1 Tax=Anisakis simplex TaxID=6269 RepID=A0A0M3JK72_ANISI|nr:unnamed protein product [Anisakis simplex]VDK30210.1 unnamed protein product [Anisakis simplex]